MKLNFDLYPKLMAGVAASAFIFSPAAAQEVEPDEPETVAEAPEEEESRQERVVVTGSLLRRSEFSSASPIQIISAEVSTLEGLIDTAEILQGSSVAAGSVQFNNQFQGFVVQGGTGINSISLRGLGANRSLVVLNGRRAGPAGTRGQVGAFDLNVIPRSVITQVEILKDGASSIYGSDAVAGVANIVTRTAVDEPEITVQYNQPFESGGESLSIDGAYGLNFDTGNIVLAAQYTLREDLSIEDRDFLRCPEDIFFDPNTGARIDREDRSRLAGTSLEGCQTIYHDTVIDALNPATRFVPNGVTVGPIPGYSPRPLAADRDYIGSPDGQAFYEDVLDSPLVGSEDAINKQELYSIYATADFEFPIFGGVNFDSEFLYTRRETTAEGWRQFFPIIGGDDVAPFGFGYDTSYVNPFGFGLFQPVALLPSNSEITVDYYYVTGGLQGDFTATGIDYLSDWSWSTYASFSRSDGDYATDSILASNSGDVTLTSIAPQYDPFTAAFLRGEDDAATDLLITEEVGNTIYEQSLINAVVTGPLFDLPAGEVGIAVGVEAREFEIDDTPSENSISGNLWGQTSATETRGSDDVVEFFTEVEIPILKGVPMFEELTFNGSARTFNYASYGTGDVWKVGLNWQINPELRLRYTKGTSYRAPALFELFLGDQTSFLGQAGIDACINWQDSTNENIRANCAADGIPPDFGGGASSAEIITGGGADVLEAETSDASTVGVIWTPEIVDFSIAVDYFDISVNEQVAQLGAASIIGGCYGSNNFPNAFCDLFVRNGADDPFAAFAIDTVNDSFLNVNEQVTRGIDITARYEQSFDFGDFLTEIQATRTLTDIVFLFDNDQESGFDTTDFNGTVGDPEWVANGRFTLERGDFLYTWSFDYIGEVDQEDFDAEFVGYFNYPGGGRRIIQADEVIYHDFSVQWRGDTITVTGGVANFFDETPPAFSSGVITRRGNVPLVGGYDLRGRTGFIRATKTF
ncbi:MAG: TonB-dependent receptor [Pseudomonadota bacterium]